MGCTQGTTSLAERPEPLGRRTESLYYLSLIVGKKAGQRTQTRVMLTKSAFHIFILEAAPRRTTYPRVWPPAEVPYRHAPAHPFCSLQLLQIASSRLPDSPRSTSSSRATVPSSCILDPFSSFLLFSSVPSTDESPFRASQLGLRLNPILPF